MQYKARTMQSITFYCTSSAGAGATPTFLSDSAAPYDHLQGVRLPCELALSPDVVNMTLKGMARLVRLPGVDVRSARNMKL